MLPIRPYDPAADLGPCLDIWLRASRVGHPFLGAERLAADEVLVRDHYIPGADMHVAFAGPAPVGFVALLGGFVGGLFVAPERHGQGIGRALVEHAACLRGVLDVDVYEQNLAARRFYHRLGFVVRDRRDQDDQGRAFAVLSMHRDGR